MSLNTPDKFPAVRLLFGGAQRYKLVQNVADAAMVLVEDWPCDDGEEYINALVVCLNAYKRAAPALAAREALLRAADEVRIPHLSIVC
ncbi:MULTISPECIES: DUF982 domain-containing protein [unclassified Rhizobium]|uniref:DUF982 domain-containing protein n=1 Tax=unclassified Rhizobium TaxID=2613769 RepID=UPI00161FE6AD|nr:MULTISPECIES: DUF982 domain-containing protein [unclassified Rhizobium]MBB3320491.1 hypothetical protein [Rhizobium sp. BK181]MBB3545438.1 hypothetical protein [Rhizobium sp. BK399]MCS3742218.1 hypothetical protein [Rhizobium sp. BK661]MCS4096440.1 hypothetical protein [Rhizobium sp. BK176]